MVERGAQKASKERVRSQWSAQKLWMELAPKKPGVGRVLHDLDQAAVRRRAGQPESRLPKGVVIRRVDLKAVPVSLLDLGRAIQPLGEGTGL